MANKNSESLIDIFLRKANDFTKPFRRKPVPEDLGSGYAKQTADEFKKRHRLIDSIK